MQLLIGNLQRPSLGTFAGKNSNKFVLQMNPCQYFLTSVLFDECVGLYACCIYDCFCLMSPAEKQLPATTYANLKKKTKQLLPLPAPKNGDGRVERELSYPWMLLLYNKEKYNLTELKFNKLLFLICIPMHDFIYFT